MRIHWRFTYLTLSKSLTMCRLNAHLWDAWMMGKLSGGNCHV